MSDFRRFSDRVEAVVKSGGRRTRFLAIPRGDSGEIRDAFLMGLSETLKGNSCK
jgi:hypothetical protein